jgi:hypothetical protein
MAAAVRAKVVVGSGGGGRGGGRSGEWQRTRISAGGDCFGQRSGEKEWKEIIEKSKITKTTLTSDVSLIGSLCDVIAYKRVPLSEPLLTQLKNDNQWALQATDAILVDFCNFRKKWWFCKLCVVM